MCCICLQNVVKTRFRFTNSMLNTIRIFIGCRVCYIGFYFVQILHRMYQSSWHVGTLCICQCSQQSCNINVKSFTARCVLSFLYSIFVFVKDKKKRNDEFVNSLIYYQFDWLNLSFKKKKGNFCHITRGCIVKACLLS